MLIDFSPVEQNNMTLFEFASQLTIDELRAATNSSIDAMLEIIRDLDDTDVVFDPVDPDAHDPFAVEGEENIGWSIAHIIAHVTASSEENAAISSNLARGFPTSERPRYETPWRNITTKAQCVQRLEESRRMRLAYLDAWPDQPFLDIMRNVSEGFTAKFGPMNAPTAFLFGLKHEIGHLDQLRNVAQQALASKQQSLQV